MQKPLPIKQLTSTFKYFFLLLITQFFAGNQLFAQGLYKLSGSKENQVKVTGKSNVHDWAMTANNPTCEAEFTDPTGTDNIPKSLNSLSFSVNAKSLKSEHSSMDNRTYKVIKADDYPKITFKINSAVISPVAKGKFSIKTTGILNIAGVAKTISMQVNGSVNADQSITCSGTQKLKLTDYNIQPPSFMLGAMKVGDELTINFHLNFKNNQQSI